MLVNILPSKFRIFVQMKLNIKLEKLNISCWIWQLIFSCHKSKISSLFQNNRRILWTYIFSFKLLKISWLLVNMLPSKFRIFVQMKLNIKLEELNISCWIWQLIFSCHKLKISSLFQNNRRILWTYIFSLKLLIIKCLTN